MDSHSPNGEDFEDISPTEELSESPSRSQNPSNVNANGGSGRAFPRIGDQYQVSVLPLASPKGDLSVDAHSLGDQYQVSVLPLASPKGDLSVDAHSLVTYEGKQEAVHGENFLEGLPVPLMKICHCSCFPRNGKSRASSADEQKITTDTGSYITRLSSTVDVKKENSFSKHTWIGIANGDFFNKGIPIMHENPSFYNRDIKEENILKVRQIDYQEEADDTADIFSPRRKCSIKRRKVIWRNVEDDTKVSQLDAYESGDDECLINERDMNAICEKSSAYLKNVRSDILKDSPTGSEVATEETNNICAPQKKRRRRKKIAWKRVKKVKPRFVEGDSCCFKSRSEQGSSGTTQRDSCIRKEIIVPGKPDMSWSKIEEDLFTLGLFIFGKDFDAIQRFVETKHMGDILSYYYGAFFRSDSYCRWFLCRKTKPKKCAILGPRIFSGVRQQELLTRIAAHVSEIAKEKIAEIIRAFNEREVSLEEFAIKLKSISGPELLVQAVGIGQEKGDLTTFLAEPRRANHGNALYSEIPMGSLSTEEILNYLIGDIRLSKARSDDLFWEAVWPRLLARGWHSEQPSDVAVSGSRGSLVFLIPGLKKFSKRKLTKGIHYFDSVTEVLTKVASDPRLLEVESDDLSGNKMKPESFWGPEISEDEDDFTIIDTSLASNEKLARVCRKRALPSYSYSKEFQCTSMVSEDAGNASSQGSEENHTLEKNHSTSNSDEETCVRFSFQNPDQQNGILKKPSKRRRGVQRPSSCWGQSTYAGFKDFAESTSYGVSNKSRSQKETSKTKSEHEFINPAKINNNTEIQSSSAPKITKCLPINDITKSLNSTKALTPSFPLTMEIMHFNKAAVVQDNKASNVVKETYPCLSESQIEDLYCSEEETGCAQEVHCNSGVAVSSSSGLDTSQVDKPQENGDNNSENIVRRQSKRTRPLTAKAMEAYACGFYGVKSRKKRNGEKLSNKDSCRMKSVSTLVQENPNGSLN